MSDTVDDPKKVVSMKKPILIAIAAFAVIIAIFLTVGAVKRKMTRVASVATKVIPLPAALPAQAVPAPATKAVPDSAKGPVDSKDCNGLTVAACESKRLKACEARTKRKCFIPEGAPRGW